MRLLKNIQQYYFVYLISFMVIMFVSASFYRFYIKHDYLVSYEGDCDPTSESCFIYCEDDNCTEPVYYSVIERNAAPLYDICGPDVTTCDEAYTCDNDSSCSIYFCDPEIDGSDACVSDLSISDI